MTEHSPLPWTVESEKVSEGWHLVIYDAKRQSVVSEIVGLFAATEYLARRQADYALIVEAVNNSRPIEDVLSEIAAKMPREDWQDLPADLPQLEDVEFMADARELVPRLIATVRVLEEFIGRRAEEILTSPSGEPRK